VETGIQKILETVSTVPGQGGLLEQFDKRLRKLQRKMIFELFEKVSKEEKDRPDDRQRNPPD
jgi:adenylosuccinate lyase